MFPLDFQVSSCMGQGASSETQGFADMSGSVASIIAERVAKSTVVIYSKTQCPYCVMAKKVTLNIWTVALFP